MIQQQKKFKGHVISIEKISIMLRYFIFMFLLCTIIVRLLFPIFMRAQIPTTYLLTGIKQTILPLYGAEKRKISFSPYQCLADTMISINASEVMRKKYAAHYGGILKIKKSPSASSKSEILDGVIEENIAANGITFINTPKVSINAEELLNTPLRFNQNAIGPRVLIVHTHTSEAYAESRDSRSEENELNVVAVGAEIKRALEAGGITAIHDTTQNDNPSYNQSYKKALTVIEKNLEAYPSIEIVLDIHRDYIKREDGTLSKPTVVTKDGSKAAQIMFVVGTDAMGLHHPNWRHNLAFSVKIQSILNEIQPELCRSVNIRTERFNQHATMGSLIIEVGTGVNTVHEAKSSGKLIGEAVAKLLKT